jgi:hypothetical protein
MNLITNCSYQTFVMRTVVQGVSSKLFFEVYVRSHYKGTTVLNIESAHCCDFFLSARDGPAGDALMLEFRRVTMELRIGAKVGACL